MKAWAVEYRFRYLIHAAIFTLGFWAPWCGWLGWARGSAWLFLAVYSDRAGVATLATATVGLLCFGIACATAGAWLRTWGTAYLGSGVVADGGMHGEGVQTNGPFRYVRNPLYLGTWLHTLALGLLMPLSGAVFCIMAIGVLQVRLILREEPFLREKLGAAYAAYCGRVPRLLPAWKPMFQNRDMGHPARAAWGQAVLGEVYFWGVTGSFAVLGWRYNAFLLMKCVVVAAGAGLVGMGLVGKKA